MHRLAGLFAAFVILCGSALPSAFAEDKTLTVFAAASMKNALDDIDLAFTAKTGVKVNASYAASSALAKQIEQGAPADIFASADTDWMDYAINKKNVTEPSRVNLLGNSIVLIAPKDSKIDNVAALISPSSWATARLPRPTSRRCRSANMPRRRWRSLAPGPLPNPNSP
jgi:molybdate transport system substrate-binding protein